MFNSGTGTSYDYAHSISIDTIISVEAFHNSGGLTFPVIAPFAINYSSAVFASKTHVSVRRGTSAAETGNITATIRYTKT